MKRNNLKPRVCPFCNSPYDNWGNNCAPLIGGHCCDECNEALVIPVRLLLLRHQLKKSAAQRGNPAA